MALFGSTMVPGPGSVRRMSPASMSASKAGSPTVTVNPAFSSSRPRPWSTCRARRGTVSASAICSDTSLPCGTGAPAAGAVPSTVPGSAWGRRSAGPLPMAKPATTSLFSASSADFPVTSGTVIGAGPGGQHQRHRRADRQRCAGGRVGAQHGARRHHVVEGRFAIRRPRSDRQRSGPRSPRPAVVPAGIAGTCGRPLETSRSTSEPRSCSVPAAGSDLATCPAGDVVVMLGGHPRDQAGVPDQRLGLRPGRARPRPAWPTNGRPATSRRRLRPGPAAAPPGSRSATAGGAAAAARRSGDAVGAGGSGLQPGLGRGGSATETGACPAASIRVSPGSPVRSTRVRQGGGGRADEGRLRRAPAPRPPVAGAGPGPEPGADPTGSGCRPARPGTPRRPAAGPPGPAWWRRRSGRRARPACRARGRPGGGTSECTCW